MVFELPSRAGTESAPARSSVQHALPAAHQRESCGGGWTELRRSARPRRSPCQEVQRAKCEGHYQLQYVSSVSTNYEDLSSWAKRELASRSHAQSKDPCKS